MNRKMLVLATLALSALTSGFVLMRIAPSQQPQPPGGGCVIVLGSHQDGDAVGREAKVTGTAHLANGEYLWVVARRHDFAPLWWLQREAKVDPITRKFEAVASFGGGQDIDWEFDLGVIALDEQGHRILKEKWLAAMESEDWKPVRIPATACPPKVIRVRKVSH